MCMLHYMASKKEEEATSYDIQNRSETFSEAQRNTGKFENLSLRASFFLTVRINVPELLCVQVGLFGLREFYVRY